MNDREILDCIEKRQNDQADRLDALHAYIRDVNSFVQEQGWQVISLRQRVTDLLRVVEEQQKQIDALHALYAREYAAQESATAMCILSEPPKEYQL